MNKKGVTLIELIIVFVIIAIMAAFIVPGIGSWLPRYRLRSATRDIISTMRTAQVRAVSNNIQYRVNLNDADIGANNYVLQYQTTTGVTWVNDGAVQSLPPGISISANTLPGKYAQFNPSSQSSSGTVTLKNIKGATKSITLTPSTGRVTGG